MKPRQTIYQVDAFTTQPFKGNPAVVCIVGKEPNSEWMQNIAMEITPEFKRVTGMQPQELYQTGFDWTLALMRSEKEVRKMNPHFSLMKNSIFGDLIVTAESEDPTFDFCVRCFAPAVGIDEDPVTGSAHCALVPFWSERTGRKDFNSHQVSKREGILKVSLKGNRVEISGQAKTIFKARLFV